MEARLRIVLLGSGSVAENLTSKLRNQGHSIDATIRENSEKWSLEELYDSGVWNADLVIVITGKDDSSFALALAARRIYGKRALAVMTDPCKARTYQRDSIYPVDVVCSEAPVEESVVKAVEFCRPRRAPSFDYLWAIKFWLLTFVLAGAICLGCTLTK
jgi:hypothetical protein